MTVCIAAICDEGRSLINVSDDQIGVGFTAGELGRTKWDGLCKNWHVGFAGTVSNATYIIELASKYAHQITSTTVADMRSLLERSYRSARLERAEAEYLSSRGWDLTTFKEHGSSKLPESIYVNIDTLISVFDYNAELIVAGWGEKDDYPTILTVENPGICIDHSRLGFWCIGSGATAAQMSLFGRNYSPDMSLEEATYYIVEAKINAEHATGVGKRIDAFIIKKGDQEPRAFSENTTDEIRSIWEQLKPREFGESHRVIMQTLDEFKSHHKPRK